MINLEMPIKKVIYKENAEAQGIEIPFEKKIITKGISENGTYLASDDNVDGYDVVEVNMPNGEFNVIEEENEDGTYNLVINDWDYVPTPSFDTIFENNSWEQIQMVSNDISSKSSTYPTSTEIEQYVFDTYGWSIGDTKTETLTTGEVITLRIIGFNHDTLSSDHITKAGITMQMVECLATRYPTNSTDTNAGGWGASKMRTETMPTIKATLSSDLQNVIKTVDKKAANGGGSNYSTTETLSDDLFLLADVEIFGSAQDGANEGTQYEYWVGKAATDRIKKYDADADGLPEKATYWWERSSPSSHTNYFHGVHSNGSANYYTANSSYGVAFAFCV